jgi:hypothetical protein
VLEAVDGTHAAWPEFWITNKPVPGVRSPISDAPRPAGEHDFGFALDGCNSDGTTTGVGGMWQSRNYVTSDIKFTSTGCVKKGDLTHLNHFELRISQSRVEVWGTDPGSTTLVQLAVADNVGLSFTRGLVWLSDAHYNARKADVCECGDQWDHTFAWDNLGFDGPKTYRDLSFDVKDANTGGPVSQDGRPTSNLGYFVGTTPTTLSTASVFRNQTPTGALVTFNAFSSSLVVPSVSINGGPWIDTPWPFDGNGYFWRTIAIPVPVNQVRDGVNQIQFKTSGDGTVVANINVILVAGAPVP